MTYTQLDEIAGMEWQASLSEEAKSDMELAYDAVQAASAKLNACDQYSSNGPYGMRRRHFLRALERWNRLVRAIAKESEAQNHAA